MAKTAFFPAKYEKFHFFYKIIGNILPLPNAMNNSKAISVDSRVGMREGQKFTVKRLFLKHKYWIRVMYVIVALYFLIIVIGALTN